MKPYTIMARVQVDISLTIYAESLADAVERSKKLEVSDFVRPAKHADDCFNSWNDFEIYGVFRA